MTNEELWSVYGGASTTKSGEIEPWQGFTTPGAIGNTVNLPERFGEWQESLWETLTFQPNINAPRFSEGVGLSLAVLCADVKARDISTCEMVLWRKKAKSWEAVSYNQHPFARMLAFQPNEVQSWTDFWRMTVLHLELAQEAFILKRYDRMGNLLEMLPVAPPRVRMLSSKSGRIFYEIASRNEFEAGQIGTEETVTLPANYVIHIRGRQSNGLSGLSSLRLGNPLFELAQALSNYRTGLFAGHGKTPMVFEMDGDFGGNTEASEAAFSRLKRQLSERMKKMHSHGEPIVLEAGMKAKQIAASARDSMTAEMWNQTVAGVCTLMQTPPHKIFHYDSVKYDNQAAADAQYANSCLRPLALNIEQKINLGIFTDGREPYPEFFTHSVEFDRHTMMAGDPKQMAEMIDKAVQSGLMEIDEARERLPLNLNPLPNGAGEVRYVPVNLAMVDREGNVIQQVAEGQNNNTGEDPVPANQPAQTNDVNRDLVRVVEKSLEAARKQPEQPSTSVLADAFAEALSKALREAPAPVVNVQVPEQPKVIGEVLEVLERDEKGGISRTHKRQIYEGEEVSTAPPMVEEVMEVLERDAKGAIAKTRKRVYR